MSRWNAITTADVLDEFTPAEQAALQNIQGATTNLANILAKSIKKVRGDCLRGGNRIGPEGTIPDSLAQHAIAYTRWRWLVSIPQAKAMQTLERKDLYTEAMTEFKLVAKGDPKVELPEEAEILNVPTPENAVELATQPDPGRLANRKKMDGLI